MTTPAVNDFVRTDREYYWYARDPGHDYVLINQDSLHDSIFTRVRPASINNPKDSFGWRNPSNWGFAMQRQSAGGFGRVEVKDFSLVPNHTDYYGNLLEGQCFPGLQFTFNSGFPDWMETAAVQKAYKKLKNSEVNLSVAFAERKETEELFVDVTHRIGAAVKAFKGKHSKKLWNLIKSNEGTPRWKTIPDEWLRLQYGWNPLMADVKGACAALDKKRNGGTWIVARGGSRSSSTDYVGRIGSVITSYAFHDFFIDSEYQCKCVLSYSVENQIIRALSQVGITNPVELVWERIPYSFVVDWFLPVGDWISSWDADFGLAFRGGTITKFQRSKGHSQPGVTNNVPDFVQVDNATNGFKAEYINMKRTVLGEPPSVGIPHFKNPFSSTHIANALSLLRQAFR